MHTRTGVTTIIFATMLAAGGVSLPAAPAMAQATDPCLALPTDAERLVCMRDSRAASAATGAAQQPVQAAPAPAAPPATPAATAAASAASQSAADRCLALPSDAERLSCMRDALAIAEAQIANQQAEDDDGFLGLGLFGGGDGGQTNALVASESEFASGIGAEQLEGYRAPQEDISVPATIVSYDEWAPGINQFELDNGQVWRQLGGDTQQVRLGRGSHPVELYGSWAGGYRMRIPSQRQTVLVQRIR